MSNLVTNICRPLRIRPTPKCVLMALADRADDDGVAWPSLAWLCEWTCFSRRAVINALDELEDSGLVRISKIVGKNSRCEIVLQKVVDDAANPCTTCTGTRAGGAPVDGEENGSDPGTTCTSAADAPVQEVHPNPCTTCTGTRAGGAPVDGEENGSDPGTTCTSAADAPVQEVHPNPCTTCTGTRAGGAPGGAGGAPDTSITSIKTSNKTRERRAKSSFDAGAIELPDWLPADAWAMWVRDRADRRKSVTEAGARLQLRSLEKLRTQGHDPVLIIELAIASGWQGFFAAKDGSTRRADAPKRERELVL